MHKIILTLTVIASLFFMACNTHSASKSFVSELEKVTPKEAATILNGNALLIDVREPNEFAEQTFDVINNINIPLDSIEYSMNCIPTDKQVILACAKGGRSQKAFEILKSKGYRNIANLEGGMIAWCEAGLPTKAGIALQNASGTKTNQDTTTADDKSCCSGSEKSEYAVDKGSSVAATKNRKLIEVYAFHGTRQCETCINMKANTKATLEKYFPEELKNGIIVFKIIDVDDKANEKIAEKFQATGTALMVNNIVNGNDNILDWSDFAFDKANNAEAFMPELKIKISNLLN